MPGTRFTDQKNVVDWMHRLEPGVCGFGLESNGQWGRFFSPSSNLLKVGGISIENLIVEMLLSLSRHSGAPHVVKFVWSLNMGVATVSRWLSKERLGWGSRMNIVTERGCGRIFSHGLSYALASVHPNPRVSCVTSAVNKSNQTTVSPVCWNLTADGWHSYS